MRDRVDLLPRSNVLPRWSTRALLLAVLATMLVVGAGALRILVDDAFITFRYVSNARDGHGLVWNPPPFLPVEGYTSFLWELLLWAAWSWFGVEPPRAANGLSIGCGLVSLAILAVAAFRLRHRDGRAASDVVAFAALVLVVGNRTFLQWLTGGLDTALFNAGLLAWVVLAFRARERRTTGWLAAWAAAAAVVGITRPDGLLVVTATLAAAGFAALRHERPWRHTAAGSAPLLAVLAHQAWRISFYGEWLPNTWHAKVGAPWPEAGVHYLACFCLEHGTWLWLVLALVWLAVELARGPASCWRCVREHVPAVVAIGVVLFHVGYYTLRVGGDHFDYRMLSHLIALLGLSAAAMAVRLHASTAGAMLWLVLLALASSFGWVHLALTEFRIAPHYDALSVHVPAWAKPVARWYDRHRLWLQAHFVCVRFQHGLSLDEALALVPPRQRGLFDANDIPIARFSAVGMTGWVLPDVAILDELGLNDWVVARNKPEHWTASPAPLVRAALATADADGDGIYTRAELQAAFRAIPGQPTATADAFVELLLLLFAGAAEDRLTRAEAAATEPFFAELRLMLHECAAPPGYIDAFDPNVTIEDRRVVVRKRDVPLTADAVRAIEAEWRQRVRAGR